MIPAIVATKPLSSKMVRNVAFGGLRALLVAPVPFLLTPLMLRSIGVRGYGIWAIFVAMNSLTSLADMGLLGTLSKYVAQYNANNDIASLNRLLNTGLVVFCALATVLAGGLWLVSAEVVKVLFRGSTQVAPELMSFFHLALVLLWINIVTFLSASVTSGMQRLDLTNLLAAGNVVSAAVFSAVFLLLRFGIKGLLYGNIISATITLVSYSLLIRKLIPQFALNLFLADAGEAKKLFAFSWRVYLVQAAGAIQNQFEKILLAMLVGVVPVGWFDIASDTALKVRGVPALLLGPILPASSELDARNEKQKLNELYYRSHKYLAFCAVPLILFAIVISRRFVELWLGANLAPVALPLSVLLAVNFINLTTGPGLMILMGQSQLWQGVCAAMTGLVVGAPLSFWLIYKFGFHGAVVGASVSSITSSALFFYFFNRYTKQSIGTLARDAYLSPVAFSSGILLIECTIQPVRNLSWLGLVAHGLIFALLYLGTLLSIRFFDLYDWEKLESVFPSARFARRFANVSW